MAYKVIIMPPAKRRLDMYVYYTLETLKNKQAAKNILADAKITARRLSKVADALKICDNPVLRNAYADSCNKRTSKTKYSVANISSCIDCNWSWC